MQRNLPIAMLAIALACAAAHGQSLLNNAGFEAVRTVKGPASGDIGFGVWKLGPGRDAPTHWTLNSAFPGECFVPSEGVHSGKRFLRIRASGQRGTAHVFQPCPGMEAGARYKIAVWVRGGNVTFQFYEYFKKGPMGGQRVLTTTPGPDQWKRVMGYYAPRGGDNFKSASLAIAVAKGQTVDVDDIEVERMSALDLAKFEPVVMENERLRMTLSPHGELTEFVCKKTGVNYVDARSAVPMFRLRRADGELPVQWVRRRGDLIEVQFMDPSVKVSLKLEARPHYLTLAVEDIAAADVESLQLCDLPLTISKNVGTLVNAAWNDEFAACVLACNDRTYSYGASSARARLCAKCYGQYGVKGAKIVIIGTPTSPPDAASALLDVIEEVELEQGLPHPTINGVWIKRAPERFASYLMAGRVSEKNIDTVLEIAKGGFGCVEIYPWHSTPTYGVHPRYFADGLAGLKRCADRIHAAGLQLGLHTMQGMVGWGGKHDPYIQPKADPRLLQDRHATLAAAVDAKATELVVKENVTDWPDEGDLFVDGEIVRYARHTEKGFVGCQRGLHRTHAKPHPAGRRLGHLVNCFNMWGNCIYAPDVNSTMIDEVCDNIARVFNEVGADMAYFDGGEEVAVQPPHWRNQGRIALGVMRRLKKPVVLEGNALYTHLSWHVITRGSPSFDPIYYGRRDYTLRAKGQNPARWAKNLLTGDVGWFCVHVHSPSTYAVTPDELMLLCLKALGGKAPISVSLTWHDPYANKRLAEMLAIIRACDELKRREYFSDEVCAELAKPMAEHVLERTPQGEWVVRPQQFGPTQLLTAQRAGANEWSCKNPYADQDPWVRLRARTRLSRYGDKGNVVLADFAQGVEFKPDGSASAQLVQSVEPSAEKTPDGSSAFCYQALNNSKQRSSWCRSALTFPKPLDLSSNRPMGVWVKAAGTGGILNVQYVQGYGFRDHYIDLDYTGWRYHELDPGETSRFWDYRWPHSFVPLMYWHFRYPNVKGLNLYYNALPPGAEVSCLIGRIEALREHEQPLVSPALEAGGQQMVLPVSLKPDEYLELDWDGKCRHFGPNGGLVAEVQPRGRLRLTTGENRVRFTCETGESVSPRAEVTLAVKGQPLSNRKKRAGEPLKSRLKPQGDEVRLVPGSKGEFRLVKGMYELVGRQAARTIPAFDGKANVWTVANEKTAPQRCAVVISRAGAGPDTDYNDPKGLLLESFDDLAGYELSKTNRFEKYVLGGGKQLAKCGPVRAGVSQTFAPDTADARVGRCCGTYAAVNKAGPGGWCAKGKRFAKPLDLSAYEAVAMWVHGDGKRETLRFQFRDVAGRYADWLVPIDFRGWRLLVFKTADRPDFNWKATEYVIFYFNDIPARATVTVKLDDLKAIPKLRQPPALNQPVLSINGKPIALSVKLGANEALTIEGAGTCTVWRGTAQAASVNVAAQALVLKPGPNRFELSCDASKGAPRDVSVRVLCLGPVED